MIDIVTAQQFLQIGKIIVYPTDTVYGLGCLPSKSSALDELLILKNRNRQFIILIDHWDKFKHWIAEPINTSSLGSPRTTWVFKATNTVPKKLTNQAGELAIRMITHEPTRSLIAGLDEPLISTSANLPQEPTPTTPEGIKKVFSYPILSGGNGGQKPSTIIHYKSGQIIRP